MIRLVKFLGKKIGGGIRMLITGKRKTSDDYIQNYDLYKQDYTLRMIEYWKMLYAGYCGRFNGISYNTRSVWSNGSYKEKKDMTFNGTKLVCEYLSGLNNAENVSIDLKNKVNDAFIQDVIEYNNFKTNFNAQVEKIYAMGGGAIKVNQKQIGEKVFYDWSFVGADRFIPTQWNNSKVMGGIFITKKRDGKHWYWLFEDHKFQDDGTYTITNKLYKANAIDNLRGATIVSLKTMYPELEEYVAYENVEYPMFSYFKPNAANNIDTDSPVGISIINNATNELLILDSLVTSFHRDIRKGGKTIVMPKSRLKTHEIRDTKTGKVIDRIEYYDTDDEDLLIVNDTKDGNADIKDITHEIRVEDHVRAINAMMDQLSIKCGLSAGTFSFDNLQGMQTATQVISSKDNTWRTKMKHEKNFEQGISNLIASTIQVAHASGEQVEWSDEGVKVEIKFDDSMSVDDEKNLETGFALNERQIMGSFTLLTDKKYGLGISEETAKLWIADAEKEAEKKLKQQQELMGFNDDPLPEEEPID